MAPPGGAGRRRPGDGRAKNPDHFCRKPCPDLPLRLFKRHHAVEKFKEGATYAFLRAQACAIPEAPAPNLELTKRAWEHVFGEWKEAVCLLAAALLVLAAGESYEALPGPRSTRSARLRGAGSAPQRPAAGDV